MYQIYGVMAWREIKFGCDDVVEGVNEGGGKGREIKQYVTTGNNFNKKW